MPDASPPAHGCSADPLKLGSWNAREPRLLAERGVVFVNLGTNLAIVRISPERGTETIWSGDYPRAEAVSNGAIYFLTVDGSGLYRVPRDGTVAIRLGDVIAEHLAADADYVYVAYGDRLTRRPVTGGEEEVVVLGATGGELGVDDRFVYASQTEPPMNEMFPIVTAHLWRWPKGAPSDAGVRIVSNIESHFFFGDDYLYALSRDSGRIFRYDKDGSNMTKMVEQVDASSAIVAVAPSAHRLAWARVESCDSLGVCRGAIYQMDESGGAITSRRELARPPIAFAADDECFYWLEKGVDTYDVDLYTARR
jgi:hypothetical protein